MTAARGMRTTGALLALLMVLAACGCAGPSSNGSLTVLVAWGGAELTSFSDVVAAFTRKTGISVHIETTRALSEELGADLQDHNAPDIADLPSAGAIVQYAKDGDLKPLGNVVNTADYGAPWSDLIRPLRPLGDSNVYAVPVKIDVKSLIWYDPAQFASYNISVPATWSQLLGTDATIKADGGSPWCLALATPPTSGWPGADWIADILLSQYGPTVYQEWVSGKLPWTNSDVESAWQTWGNLIGAGSAVYQGPDGALATTVGTVHPSPGGCYMQHGALVDEGFAGQKFPASYGFFPLPAPRASASTPIQVSGDFIGVFTPNPLARKLVSYLTTATAQEQFVGYPGVDGFSADSQVPVSTYRNGGPTVQIAQLLRQRELCFGAADAMPQDLSADFHQAVLEYMAAPKTLKSKILPELQAETQAVASLSADAPAVCGRPNSGSGKAS